MCPHSPHRISLASVCLWSRANLLLPHSAQLSSIFTPVLFAFAPVPLQHIFGLIHQPPRCLDAVTQCLLIFLYLASLLIRPPALVHGPTPSH